MSVAKKGVDVVICGAGVVGVAAAYNLTNKGKRVLLVDERPAVSYTSCLSTECYRNFWSDNVPMTSFMNRSIELLEQHASASDNQFNMNRKGYTFLTATDAQAEAHVQAATVGREIGIGEGRVFTSGGHGVQYDDSFAFDADVSGIDVFQGQAAIQDFLGSGNPIIGRNFIGENVSSVMHVRKCGWMNAQQMGAYVLSQAKAGGCETAIPYTLQSIKTSTCAGTGAQRVSGVEIKNGSESITVDCDHFINCGGPFVQQVNQLVPGSDDIPVENEIHSKVVLKDVGDIVPGNAPMMIWDDMVDLKWSDEEREYLAEMEPFEQSLVNRLPAGAHFRPYPGAVNSLIMLWEFAHMDIHPDSPPEETPALRDHVYPELIIRAISDMIPSMADYLEAMPPVTVDGGYYTKVPDNLPMVGGLGVEGAHICACLSGYGIMGANAAGELVAQSIVGEDLPDYAATFDPKRWQDEAYVEKVRSGQVRGLQI